MVKEPSIEENLLELNKERLKERKKKENIFYFILFNV